MKYCSFLLIVFSINANALSSLSFTQLEEAFSVGTRPSIELMLNHSYSGGCFTAFSNAEFPNSHTLTFEKESNQFNALYTDIKTGVITPFSNIIVNDNIVETRAERLSNEAYFKMTYKEAGDILVEKISMYEHSLDEEFIVNFCYYRL